MCCASDCREVIPSLFGDRCLVLAHLEHRPVWGSPVEESSGCTRANPEKGCWDGWRGGALAIGGEDEGLGFVLPGEGIE